MLLLFAGCWKQIHAGDTFSLISVTMLTFACSIFIYFFCCCFSSTPPVAALKEILFSNPRMSFYGFLMAIAKSEAINEHIGE